MASNGRRASDASYASSADFYEMAAGQQTEQVDAPRDDVASTQPSNAHSNGHYEDGDSGSEMDVSDVSSTISAGDSDADEATHTGSKRKLDSAESGPEDESAAPDGPSKKRRLSTDEVTPLLAIERSASERWPADVWQQVLMQLSPAMLARCMRVSKYFKHLLTNMSPPPPLKKGAKRLHDSEYVWMHSRKDTYPTIPRPLEGLKEREMMALIGARNCQTCGKAGVKPPATSVFNSGPGDNGVRVIWPFQLRICGLCFRNDALTVSLDDPGDITR